jgi:hypothetical protein
VPRAETLLDALEKKLSQAEGRRDTRGGRKAARKIMREVFGDADRASLADRDLSALSTEDVLELLTDAVEVTEQFRLVFTEIGGLARLLDHHLAELERRGYQLSDESKERIAEFHARKSAAPTAQKETRS